eukprot:gene5388-5926_t
MPGTASLMPTLFVGDLPADCSENELRMLFEPFGPIVSIRMKKGSSGKDNHVYSSRPEEARAFYYAFVKFDQRKSAEVAFQSMQGFFYRGRTLRVGWTSISDDHAPPRTNTPGGSMGGQTPPMVPMHMTAPTMTPHSRTAQVHFSYLSKQLEFIITEAFLWDVFSSFGEVMEISLKKSSCDEDMCIQNGYGFTHYPLNDQGIASALKAVSALHQVTIHSVTYDCSVSNQLKQLIARSPGLGSMAAAAATTSQLRRVAHVTGQYIAHEPTMDMRLPYAGVGARRDVNPYMAPHQQPGFDRYDRSKAMYGNGMDGGFGRGDAYGGGQYGYNPSAPRGHPAYGAPLPPSYGRQSYNSQEEYYASAMPPYEREQNRQVFDENAWQTDRSLGYDPNGYDADQRSVDTLSYCSVHSGGGGGSGRPGSVPYGRYDNGPSRPQPVAAPYYQNGGNSSANSVSNRSWLSASTVSSRTGYSNPPAISPSPMVVHDLSQPIYEPAATIPLSNLGSSSGSSSSTNVYGPSVSNHSTSTLTQIWSPSLDATLPSYANVNHGQNNFGGDSPFYQNERQVPIASASPDDLLGDADKVRLPTAVSALKLLSSSPSQPVSLYQSEDARKAEDDSTQTLTALFASASLSASTLPQSRHSLDQIIDEETAALPDHFDDSHPNDTFLENAVISQYTV